MRRTHGGLIFSSVVFALFATGCGRVRVEDFSDRTFNGPPFARIAVEYIELTDTVYRGRTERMLVSILQKRSSAVQFVPMCEVVFTDGWTSDQELAGKLSKEGCGAFLTVRRTRSESGGDLPVIGLDASGSEESDVAVSVNLDGGENWFVCELVDVKSMRSIWRATAVVSIGWSLTPSRSSVRRLGRHLAKRLAAQGYLI